jgi:hypothetical protein
MNGLPMNELSIASLLLTIALPAAAGSCDELRDEIEAKIRASGVQQFSVTVVDAGALAPGRVVGTCGRGSQKIVYQPGSAGTARAKPAPMLVECKDGRVRIGGDCRR